MRPCAAARTWTWCGASVRPDGTSATYRRASSSMTGRRPSGPSWRAGPSTGRPPRRWPGATGRRWPRSTSLRGRWRSGRSRSARRPVLALATLAASITILAHRLGGLVRDPVAVATRVAGGGTARAALPVTRRPGARVVPGAGAAGWPSAAPDGRRRWPCSSPRSVTGPPTARRSTRCASPPSTSPTTPPMARASGSAARGRGRSCRCCPAISWRSRVWSSRTLRDGLAGAGGLVDPGWSERRRPVRYRAAVPDRPPLAVLVSGAPGSGKSTLARALGRRPGRARAAQGRTRPRDAGGPATGRWSSAAPGVEPFYRTMELWLELGVSFVAEQTFYRGRERARRGGPARAAVGAGERALPKQARPGSDSSAGCATTPCAASAG